MVKRVVKQIEPLDEEELEKDIRFAFNNRSETEDQFVDEMIGAIKYHVNEAMSRYQNKLVDDLAFHMKNEIIGVVLRNKRETIVEEDNNDW